MAQHNDGFEIVPPFSEPEHAVTRSVEIAVQHHRDEYELERQSERSVINGPNGLQVQITHGDSVEIRPLQEFPKLNMLTMAENYARNPLITEPDIERFWDATIVDTENFGSLHTRMTEDIALKIFMLEKVEEIFRESNRRFAGNLDKFRINFRENMPAGFDKKPFVIPEPAKVRPSTSTVKAPGAPKRKVTGPVGVAASVTENELSEVPRFHHAKNKILVPTAFLVATAVGLAACGVFKGGEDDTSSHSDTLPSMITLGSTTSTTELPTTTTTILEGCGDTIMVEPDQNLTEIANKCRVTLGELSMWNNLPNIDDIDAGQVLLLKAPPTTSTALETTTTTQAPVPETTVALTTVPPPPTTVKIEPLNNKDNPKDCAAIGGIEKIAPAEITGLKHIRSFDLTEEQVTELVYRRGILKDFGLEIIIAGTKECFISSREAIKTRYGI